jgi:hypothetical protein
MDIGLVNVLDLEQCPTSLMEEKALNSDLIKRGMSGAGRAGSQNSTN